MVSQLAGPAHLREPRIEGSSRERLLTAAALEFAARGFDGAKVDRIARRARVNKAMLYYHFASKAALYRAILIDLFEGLATSLSTLLEQKGDPDDRIRRFIRTVADATAARPHFPANWLREMAEGGRHLDLNTVQHIAKILVVLKGILEDGRTRGSFVEIHPLVAQMGIVAPLLLFTASAPLRERFQHHVPVAISSVDREAVIAHVEQTTLAALHGGSSIPSGSTHP